MPAQPPYPRINPTFYRLVCGFFAFLFNIATRRHATGQAHIPAHGPLILVSNHLSYVDTPLLGIEMPHLVHGLGAEKYEYHPFRIILSAAGTIFINRGEVDRRALRLALSVLEAGENLAVAIEGTRSKTGGLIEGKTGAAYLATRANVPILPVVVYGTEKVIPNLLRLRRTDVYTTFGPLIHLPAGRARTTELHACTEQIMVTLAAMLPEAYRGVYANHPLLHQRPASNPGLTG